MTLRFPLLATAAAMALATPAFSQVKPVYGAWGYNPAAMDRAVKPGDDFWSFVNGSWDRTTQIAADRTSAGPFVTLSDASERDVRSIVEGFANAPKRDLAGQQIGDFYASFMDEAKIDSFGAMPLKPYLAQITAAQTRPQLLVLFVATGFASPVGIGLSPDLIMSRQLARLGLAYPRANIICRTTRRWSGIVPRIVTISRQSSGFPVCLAARPRPIGSSRSRRPLPKRNGLRPTAATSTRPIIR